MKKSLVYPLLALASVIWGVSFIITKEESHITVFVILTFRLLLATAVTIPALLLFKKLEPIKKSDLKWFLLLALFEPFIYSICETSGVQLVSGSMASIVVATIPLFVPFGMAVAYKEKVRAVTLVGIVLSLVGLAVMLLPGDSGNLDANPAGLAWLAGAVLTAVFFTIVLVKLVDRYRPLTITAYQNMFGCLYFIPFMLLFNGENLPLLSYSGKMIAMLLILGICVLQRGSGQTGSQCRLHLHQCHPRVLAHCRPANRTRTAVMEQTRGHGHRNRRRGVGPDGTKKEASEVKIELVNSLIR